jgi:hypothetical protein
MGVRRGTAHDDDGLSSHGRSTPVSHRTSHRVRADIPITPAHHRTVRLENMQVLLLNTVFT